MVRQKALRQGVAHKNLVYSAPASGGKTLVAECAPRALRRHDHTPRVAPFVAEARSGRDEKAAELARHFSGDGSYGWRVMCVPRRGEKRRAGGGARAVGRAEGERRRLQRARERRDRDELRGRRAESDAASAAHWRPCSKSRASQYFIADRARRPSCASRGPRDGDEPRRGARELPVQGRRAGGPGRSEKTFAHVASSLDDAARASWQVPAAASAAVPRDHRSTIVMVLAPEICRGEWGPTPTWGACCSLVLFTREGHAMAEALGLTMHADDGLRRRRRAARDLSACDRGRAR